jgi:diguanylate cyclase (GGDEF)-like protein
MLGNGDTDPLFYLRVIFVIAVLSYYLSVIGIDRKLYAGFAVALALSFWGELMAYFPAFLKAVPSAPVALAIYCSLLLLRSRSEQARLHDSIKAQIAQHLLLEELKAQATRDALTGIFNRGWIEGELRYFVKQQDRRPEPFSLLIFDVDLFKEINDRHGHDVGDSVLRRLTERALEVLRETDVLGRWGGEEFLVLLPHTDAATAMQVAQRLLSAVGAIEFTDATGRRLKVSVSVGVAQHQPGESSEVIVKHADLALYLAKNSGRNCCRQFEPGLAEGAQ